MNTMKKQPLSDDSFDAIAALVMIAVVVGGLVFWLYGMPS